MATSVRRFVKRHPNWFMLLAFAALVLLATWPVITRISTFYAGGRDDLWIHQWNFWWIKKALSQGVNPFFTPYLYFPAGAALTSHNIAWFNTALWLPLQAVVGPITAYNLILLIVFTLNGFCMFLFARLATGSTTAGFFAGLIFGFWPYTLSHFDHTNMMVVFWVPLTLFWLHRALAAPGSANFPWKETLLAGLCLALIGITRWQLLIMSSPILFAYTLFLLLKNPQIRTKRTFRQLLLIGGVAILLMTPLAAPLVADQFTRNFPEDVFLDEAVWGRTDLLAYLIPSIHNSLWRNFTNSLYENFVVNQFYTPYLGYTTLLLAAFGVIKRWRKVWIWLLLAIFYVLLALGPELAINGRSYPHIPMPYRLVENFFLLRLVRRPDRFNLFLSLPLSMLAAWGIDYLQTRLQRPFLRRFVLVVLALLIWLAYWPLPFATTEPTVPVWYQTLAADPEQFGVLDIPINDREYDKWYMLYQTTHEKPLAVGHVSRLPQGTDAFLISIPFIGDLEARDQRPDPEITDVSSQLKLLADANIRYLVIHKRFANAGLQAIWRDWLTIDPFYEDEEVIVYRTAPIFGEDFDFEYPLTEEVGLISAAYAPQEGVQGGAVKFDLRWGTAAAPPNNAEICVAAINRDNNLAAVQCKRLPDSAQASHAIGRDQIVLPLPFDMPLGAYKLQVTQQNPEIIGRAAQLGTIFVHAADPEIKTDAVWNGRIQLLGYSWKPKTGELTLFWQSETDLEASYTVFVHLVDTHGNIIAQHDATPRSQTYPTNQWEPGETVRDVVQLPPDMIPDQEYFLRIGLYDAITGERLPVITDDAAADFVTLEPKSD